MAGNMTYHMNKCICKEMNLFSFSNGVLPLVDVQIPGILVSPILDHLSLSNFLLHSVLGLHFLHWFHWLPHFHYSPCLFFMVSNGCTVPTGCTSSMASINFLTSIAAERSFSSITSIFTILLVASASATAWPDNKIQLMIESHPTKINVNKWNKIRLTNTYVSSPGMFLLYVNTTGMI